MATFGGNFMVTSFKQELLRGCHDFTLTTGDTFKIALYTSAAGVTFNAATTTYTTTTEVAASGSYAAGGGTLTNISPTSTGTTAFTDFADITFTTATITARGALLYNTTPNTTSSAGLTNPVVLVLDFGSDRTSTASDFTIVFPTADATNAIIRIA
jgi:hypothetical protein